MLNKRKKIQINYERTLFLTRWFYGGHWETMARPSFSPKDEPPNSITFSNTTNICILRGNINLEFLKNPTFANKDNLLRDWLSIVMHITDLSNDFIQRRDPLLPHLLRVTEGNAVLPYVTCVLEAWDLAS